jgi:hypothetical protein
VYETARDLRFWASAYVGTRMLTPDAGPWCDSPRAFSPMGFVDCRNMCREASVFGGIGAQVRVRGLLRARFYGVGLLILISLLTTIVGRCV